MTISSSRWAALLGLALVTGAGMAACSAASGGTGDSSHGAGSSNGGSGGSQSAAGTGGSAASFVGSSGTGGTAAQAFDVAPTSLQTITVTAGQTTPAVKYDATSNKAPINVGWGVDKGNVGTIPAGPSSTGVFTPSGTAGGLVTVSASLDGKSVTRQVMVELTATQNGPNMTAGEQAQIAGTVGQLTAGGGVGGVGGEGLGPAVTDMPTLTALGSPTGNGAAQALTFVYPYDKTVWPRGLLAPLLMWTWSIGDADAIQISLQTKSGSFSWTGTFGRPAILQQTNGAFVRHPIPQDVWDMATNSAGGKADPLTVSLTVARGGMAYGPITETWTIAEARLSGTIYYNSYGTNFAQNSYPDTSIGTGQPFGGAVLSIRVGDTAPKLVAGTSTTGTNTGCRVCHSVAADGSRLVVQHGDNGYVQSSAYDLGASSATEHVMTHEAKYPAMAPNGTAALTSSGLLLPLPNDATPVSIQGLSGYATLDNPTWSIDGRLISFAQIASQQLYVMSFDLKSRTFSNATLVDDDSGKPAGTAPSWPAFFPDGKSLVFHHQTHPSVESFDVGQVITRSGSRAQIYWTSVKSSKDVTPLDNLNGVGYLPTLATPVKMSCLNDGTYQVGGITPDHVDDVDMNYEPTVNPAASGGYAWVVFTSRRMYGNEAVIPPFCSDPRSANLVTNITTKKLWVAAVDLTQAPGKDASHPAFYLPAQEILAGNSRGFWVLDPCKADGQSCTTGDQCCDGFCEPNGAGGALVCSTMPPGSTCSGVGDKCTTAADCCDPNVACIGGFCAVKSPP